MITFLGDTYLRRAVDGRHVGLGRYVVNLEAPVTASLNPAPNKVNLRASSWYLKESFGEWPAAVCLANNHIMDYGVDGYLDTVAGLSSAGVPFFGAGTLHDNYNNPAIVTIDGLRLALLGYVCASTSPPHTPPDGPGVAPLEPKSICRDIDRARCSGADRVVVSLHWGAEEVGVPKPDDVGTARAIIEAGADAIVGHHPHIVQPCEYHRERPIFYSLGNFVMPDLDGPSHFSTDGVSHRRFVKRQATWNRTSLAFSYVPQTREVAASLVYFDGNKVVRLRRDARCTKRVTESARRFKCAYVLGKLRRLGYDYLRSPKLPAPRHLHGLIRLLRNRDYR